MIIILYLYSTILIAGQWQKNNLHHLSSLLLPLAMIVARFLNMFENPTTFIMSCVTIMSKL